MTLPTERTKAVLQTRRFLQQLQDCKTLPGVPDAVRHEALALLRHFPSLHDLELAHQACPEWFGPPGNDA